MPGLTASLFSLTPFIQILKPNIAGNFMSVIHIKFILFFLSINEAELI